jgi:hypothetical protein
MEQAQMGEMQMDGMEGMSDMKGMKGMEGTDMPGMQTAAGDAPATRTVDGLTLTLETTPTPAEKGENTVRLTVSKDTAPVSDATVMLAYTMAMPGMEVETVKASHTQGGVYEAKVDLAMRGGWTIDATVTRHNAKPVTARFAVHAK